jgi:hypothetical protein
MQIVTDSLVGQVINTIDVDPEAVGVTGKHTSIGRQELLDRPGEIILHSRREHKQPSGETGK